MLVSIISFLILIAVPVHAPSSDAIDENDIDIVSETDRIVMAANSSTDFHIIITNTLPHLDNDLTNNRAVLIDFDNGTRIYASSDETYFVLGGQELKMVPVTVTADRFAGTGDYSFNIVVTITSLESTSDEKAVHTYTIAVHVDSSLSAGDSYNKILGIFDNPLPDPFNIPAFTAILTFVLVLILGLIGIALVLPIVLKIIFHGHKEEGRTLGHSIRKLTFLMVILYALNLSLRVLGADEEIISVAETWFDVLYIVLGAIIAWRLYLVIVQFSINRVHGEIMAVDDDKDLEPLFRLLGKLLICAVAVGLIMSALGFNLAAIITSAGIVSLGITLGAQSILNQFFSGMVLLATHPFKKDDLVRIGNSSTVYKVSEVNIMNTTFENWDNEETIIMPNNTVASSEITNVTRNNILYKIHVFIGIAYGEDVDKARNIMLRVGLEHPHTVTDGNVDMPFTRIVSFEASEIKLRLTVYVDDYNIHGSIGGELRDRIYKEFVANNIQIPYPQMDVHVDYPDKNKQ